MTELCADATNWQSGGHLCLVFFHLLSGSSFLRWHRLSLDVILWMFFLEDKLLITRMAAAFLLPSAANTEAWPAGLPLWLEGLPHMRVSYILMRVH